MKFEYFFEANLLFDWQGSINKLAEYRIFGRTK